MDLVSFSFFWIFLAFTIIYWLVNSKIKIVILLLFSLFFYGSMEPRFLIPLVLSIFIDYFVAHWFLASEKTSYKKIGMGLSVLGNLGLLAYYKYGVNVFEFDSTDQQLFPVGISFYTFQSMSYTFDVYLGRIKPERNLIKFSLFVSFFPQLLAGPIERAKKLLPQFQCEITFDSERLENGIYFFLWGLFKKVFVADQLGLMLHQFENYQGEFNLSFVLASLLMTFKVYCDFSGYSDIARGIGKILGIELSQNFKRYYYAKNPSEYWNRWNISLTTWIRDYLYTSFLPKWARNHIYIYMLGVFMLVGLWHGVELRWVIFGLVNGLFFTFYHSVYRYSSYIIMLFYNFLLGGTILGLGTASYSQLSLFFTDAQIDLSLNMIKIAAVLMAPVLFLEFFQERKKKDEVWNEFPLWLKCCFVTVISLLTIYFSGQSESFFYYQF